METRDNNNLTEKQNPYKRCYHPDSPQDYSKNQAYYYNNKNNTQQIIYSNDTNENDNLLSEGPALVEEFQKFMKDIKTNLSTCRYRRCINLIEFKELDFHELAEVSWKITHFKAICILKILEKKLYKSEAPKISKMKSIDAWLRKLDIILDAWLSNIELNESNQEQVESLIYLILKEFYFIACYKYSELNISDSAGILGLAEGIIKSFSEYMLNPKCLSISQKIYLFLSSLHISDNNFEEALVYIKSVISLALKELFLRIDIEEGINLIEIKKSAKNKYSKLFSNIVLAYYQKGSAEENLGRLTEAIESYQQAAWFSKSFIKYHLPEISQMSVDIEKRAKSYHYLMTNKLKEYYYGINTTKIKSQEQEKLVSIKQDKFSKNKEMMRRQKERETMNIINSLDFKELEFAEDEKKSVQVKTILSTMTLLRAFSSNQFKDILKEDINEKTLNNLDSDTVEKIQRRLNKLRAEQKFSQMEQERKKKENNSKLVSSNNLKESIISPSLMGTPNDIFNKLSLLDLSIPSNNFPINKNISYINNNYDRNNDIYNTSNHRNDFICKKNINSSSKNLTNYGYCNKEKKMKFRSHSNIRKIHYEINKNDISNFSNNKKETSKEKIKRELQADQPLMQSCHRKNKYNNDNFNSYNKNNKTHKRSNSTNYTSKMEKILSKSSKKTFFNQSIFLNKQATLQLEKMLDKSNDITNSSYLACKDKEHFLHISNISSLNNPKSSSKKHSNEFNIINNKRNINSINNNNNNISSNNKTCYNTFNKSRTTSLNQVVKYNHNQFVLSEKYQTKAKKLDELMHRETEFQKKILKLKKLEKMPLEIDNINKPNYIKINTENFFNRIISQNKGSIYHNNNEKKKKKIDKIKDEKEFHKQRIKQRLEVSMIKSLDSKSYQNWNEFIKKKEKSEQKILRDEFIRKFRNSVLISFDKAEITAKNNDQQIKKVEEDLIVIKKEEEIFKKMLRPKSVSSNQDCFKKRKSMIYTFNQSESRNIDSFVKISKQAMASHDSIKLLRSTNTIVEK